MAAMILTGIVASKKTRNEEEDVAEDVPDVVPEKIREVEENKLDERSWPHHKRFFVMILKVFAARFRGCIQNRATIRYLHRWIG